MGEEDHMTEEERMHIDALVDRYAEAVRCAKAEGTRGPTPAFWAAIKAMRNVFDQLPPEMAMEWEEEMPPLAREALHTLKEDDQ